MNIFRFTADLAHLVAIAILLLKIWKTRSCAGISGRSQILFLVVFVCRYLDIFTNFVSPYNTVMKVFFIGSSVATVYFMWGKFKATYDSSIILNQLNLQNHDTCRMEFLVIPAFLLALVVNHDFSVLEVLWTFSIYLEAVAIMPQLFMLSKTGAAETITAHYLFALGSYRALYILNWVYRYYTESFIDPIAVVAGIVQTVLFADFFYLYVTRVIQQNRTIQLPA
uniref:ER lumen protein-retaining receptor n=1 Tax=Ditylenchus dipsaci TaxID=166011 RepID=A0A915DYR3_9BILA